MSKQRKRSQYNEAGELVYQVGNNGPAGDVSGVKEPANKAEAQCFKLLQDNAIKAEPACNHGRTIGKGDSLLPLVTGWRF